jgi:hypothetical protein
MGYGRCAEKLPAFRDQGDVKLESWPLSRKVRRWPYLTHFPSQLMSKQMTKELVINLVVCFLRMWRAIDKNQRV